ncbi:hypothetical protein [Methylobacterium radiotolerans]|uniref:hypothetical protein n=1 Tax=Methylobacterium radiotolerans TaxID=31998 RepID=UPI001F1AB11E|nr:hypothetical protein [Methylobacterium radiotolerans]UIY44118.1 hypothetical protein LZ599_10705 [Methylobacterium radiotolerans]
MSSPVICDDGAETPRCQWCGTLTGFKRGKVLRFCPPPAPGKNSICNQRYRVANLTKEQRAARCSSQRRYEARLRSADPQWTERHRLRWREYYAGLPEQRRLERNEYERQRRQALGDAWREKVRAYRARVGLVGKQAPLAGSVLAAASVDAPGRELLARILDLAPRCDAGLREEIVSEAVLAVLDGGCIETALQAARQKVFREASRFYQAKPLQDCYWL